MVAILACECDGQPPHAHVPEKWMVRLDNDAEVAFDQTHIALNEDRIRSYLYAIPARIEWWDLGADHGRGSDDA